MGKKKLPINDKKYECKYKYSSILYDKINGLWKTQEMEDRAGTSYRKNSIGI